MQNFLSDADLAIRYAAGAPTLDAKGRVVGVYNSMDTRDVFMDWIYDPTLSAAIHTSVSTIRQTLATRGATALIQELFQP